MKINKIYVGGWFQRTMLQLSEIYDFVRGDKSKLRLNQNKLDTLRQELNIASIDYHVSGQEYVKINTTDNLVIKIFEDGLTKDAFIRTLKRVFKSKLHCIWLIDKKFGRVQFTPKPSNENDMFI